MAKTQTVEPAVETTETEESATRVGPMHEAFANFLNAAPYNADITAEQIFLVTSKRKAFRSTPEYREGVKGALVQAKEAEAAAKAERAAQREQERAAKAAEKEAKAKEREEAKAARDAEKAEAATKRQEEKAAKDAEKAAAKAAKDAEKAAAAPVVTKTSTDATPEAEETTPAAKPRVKKAKNPLAS